MNSKIVYLINAIEFLWFMHEIYSAISIVYIILFIRIPNSSHFPSTKCLCIIVGCLNSLWSFNDWLIKRRKYYLLCILVALPLPTAFVTLYSFTKNLDAIPQTWRNSIVNRNSCFVKLYEVVCIYFIRFGEKYSLNVFCMNYKIILCAWLRWPWLQLIWSENLYFWPKNVIKLYIIVHPISPPNNSI